MEMNKLSSEDFCKLLQQEFPTQFVDLYGDMTKTCMAWGIEFGSGWHQIFYDCCKVVQAYIDNNKNDANNSFKWSQLKEKFGTGRWYYNGGDEIVELIIDKYENKTNYTCETCGKGADGFERAQLRGRGWFYTACDEHTQPGDLQYAEQKAKDEEKSWELLEEWKKAQPKE